MEPIKLISFEEAGEMSKEQIDATIDGYLKTLEDTYGMNGNDAANMIANIINLIAIHISKNL